MIIIIYNRNLTNSNNKHDVNSNNHMMMTTVIVMVVMMVNQCQLSSQSVCVFVSDELNSDSSRETFAMVDRDKQCSFEVYTCSRQQVSRWRLALLLRGFKN